MVPTALVNRSHSWRRPPAPSRLANGLGSRIRSPQLALILLVVALGIWDATASADAAVLSLRPSSVPAASSIALSGADGTFRTAAPERWVQVVETTPVYSEGGIRLGLAEVGDWYRIVWQEEGWLLGVRAQEPDSAPVWLADDLRVLVILEEEEFGGLA